MKISAIILIFAFVLSGCSAFGVVDKAAEKVGDVVHQYCTVSSEAEQENRRAWLNRYTDPHEIKVECYK